MTDALLRDRRRAARAALITAMERADTYPYGSPLRTAALVQIEQAEAEWIALDQKAEAR